MINHDDEDDGYNITHLISVDSNRSEGEDTCIHTQVLKQQNVILKYLKRRIFKEFILKLEIYGGPLGLLTPSFMLRLR